MEVGVEHDRIVVADDLARPVLAYHLPAPGLAAKLTNFIHPLALDGVSITEDNPTDHPHHRGIFWAWRRVLVGGAFAADGWIGEGTVFETTARRADQTREGALIEAEGNWILSHGQARFVRERTTIAVADAGNARRLDIEIRLCALVSDVALAGSDDEKGYGGPTLRFAHSDPVESLSRGNAIEPAHGAVDTDATIVFRWRPRPAGFPAQLRARVTVDGQPWTRWVLRRGPGMQNCAFPGRIPYTLPTRSDLTLHLSLELLRAEKSGWGTRIRT